MIPLRVAMPFLRSLRGEYRMLHGKDEAPSGGEATVHLRAQAAERLDIVEGEGTYRHIERARREIDSFNRHTQVLDGGRIRHGTGLGQHPFGQVDAHHGGGPLFGGIPAMPAEAAPQIKHPLALERRKHPPQHMPLPGGVKPFL